MSDGEPGTLTGSITPGVPGTVLPQEEGPASPPGRVPGVGAYLGDDGFASERYTRAPMSRLTEIRIVEDRTEGSRCDEGFLTLRRLQLRNEYDDGSTSDVYPCDVVSRRGVDAAVAVLYELDGSRRIHVLLRHGIRAPIYLRHEKSFVHADERVYRGLQELVAGILEPSDGDGDAGIARRAAAEAQEEAGLVLEADAFTKLGDETFASPGITDEKLFFAAAPAPVHAATGGPGDGTVMEEGATLSVLELSEAIEACRRGDIPDMKSEVGLLRLADHLGYLPQLGCFVDALPADLRGRYQRLGVAAADGASSGAGADGAPSESA